MRRVSQNDLAYHAFVHYISRILCLRVLSIEKIKNKVIMRNVHQEGWEMKKSDIKRQILKKLLSLYGKKEGKKTFGSLSELLARYRGSIPAKNFELSEKDLVLITYPDSFLGEDKKPLSSLKSFLSKYLKDTVTIVHILPFFPYSSDDGFSVIDYFSINPELGSWEYIEAIENDFILMVDAVINHISSHSREFKGFLKGDERYRNFFITVDENFDTSRVFRPRALPLTTTFETSMGNLKLWTTFSADQIDLNYRSPDVLLFIIEVLLFYIARGASIIRLDAVAFLWKESGTRCLNLPQTHTIIKILRNITDLIAPHVKLITETNLPHEDNISYFGDEDDEAHMVYNFALPPLVAHAIITENASYLTEWASTLQKRGKSTYFYNFTASHDGVGLIPVHSILPRREIEKLIRTTELHWGKLGLKDNPDGKKSVYELNITYFDLLSNPFSKEPLEKQVSRFIASQAILLSMAGLPALYYHSFLGSRNYYEGVKKTGMNRSINREKLELKLVERELQKRDTICSQVFSGLKKLIEVRRMHSSFHPSGSQRVLRLHPGIFAVERVSPDGKESVLCITNVSDTTITIPHRHPCKNDLLSKRNFGEELTLKPYEVIWLKADKPPE